MTLPPKLSEADIGAPQSGAELQKKPLPQGHGKGQSEKLHGEGAGGEGMTLPPKLIEADISAPQSGAGSPEKADASASAFSGDPYGTRTHVTAVKGRCLNHLTNGPYKGRSVIAAPFSGSGTWIRTGDTAGMNRML